MQAGMGVIVTGVIAARMYRDVPFRLPALKQSIDAFRAGWTIFLSRSAVSLYTLANTFILGLFVSSVGVAYYGGAERSNPPHRRQFDVPLHAGSLPEDDSFGRQHPREGVGRDLERPDFVRHRGPGGVRRSRSRRPMGHPDCFGASPARDRRLAGGITRHPLGCRQRSSRTAMDAALRHGPRVQSDCRLRGRSQCCSGGYSVVAFRAGGHRVVGCGVSGFVSTSMLVALLSSRRESAAKTPETPAAA